MPCGQFLTSYLFHELQKPSELHGFITVNTRVRRPSLFIPLQKWIHNFTLKFLFQIKNVVGDCQIFRHLLRPCRRLRITAFIWQNLRQRRRQRVAPERKSHTHKIMPLLFQHMSNNRGVDSAGKGDENTQRRIKGLNTVFVRL